MRMKKIQKLITLSYLELYVLLTVNSRIVNVLALLAVYIN